MNFLGLIAISILGACFLRAEVALPSTTDLPPIEQIKKSVTFIYVKDERGDEFATGTGFLVGVNGKDNKTYGYLITARHVLTHPAFPILQQPAGIYDAIAVRLNRKDGGSEKIPVELTGIHQVLVPRDSTVDLLAIPFLPNPEVYDVILIPETLIATEKNMRELKVRAGDNVFFGGLFTPFPGAKRIYPIMRFGKVAMLPDEKIPMNDGVLAERYLVEAQSWAGNSGAPVFFNLDPSRDPGVITIGSPQIRLAGIMQGYFHAFSPVVTPTSAAIPGVNENTGIAVVVPAHFLVELLHGFSATLLRDE